MHSPTAFHTNAQRGRDVRYARTIINVHHVSKVCPLLYCPGATRPRQACSRLTSRFRVASYRRRVDLECDKHGISGGSKHCDDNDAQPDA